MTPSKILESKQKTPAEQKEEALSQFAKNFLERPVKIGQTEVTGLTPDSEGQCTFFAFSLVGTLTVNESMWRVLGMRPRHAEPLGSVIEYDVLQMQQKWKIGGIEVEEELPFSKREQVMRVCFSDDLQDYAAFRQEREIIKALRLEYSGNKRFYDQLPRFFAEGQLGSLRGGNSDKTPLWTLTPKIPKPFYILENVGPSLEVFRRCQRGEKMSPYCSVFLIIGCVNSLRLVHEAGIVVRDVQPSNFAIRLGPSGKLNRREADVVGRVVLTHYGLAMPFRQRPVRREGFCVGTKKYCSSSAMRMEQTTPADDLISCCYMLHELLTGSLPWCKPNNSYRHILQEKEKVETLVNIPNTNPNKLQECTYFFENIGQVYQEIKKGNGFDTVINYQEVVRRLGLGVEKWKDEEKEKSIFTYHRPMLQTYRHGILNPGELVQNSKTAETEEMCYKVDYIFPSMDFKGNKPAESMVNEPKKKN